MLRVWNTQAEIYMGNTIEFDTKMYQVVMAKVKFTSVRLKLLTVNRSQK